MEKKLFKFGLAVLLVFAIIYVGSLISWFFVPILVIVQTLFVPIILAVFLFYLLRPLVAILEKKIPRTWSIITIYLVLVIIIGGLLSNFVPIIQQQFISLNENIPLFIERIQKQVQDFQETDLFASWQLQGLLSFEELLRQFSEAMSGIASGLANNIASFVGTVVNVVIVIFIIPFILFYFLKDREKMLETLLGVFKPKRQEHIKEVLVDIDKTLSSYIQGQGLVCLIVGLLCLVAFLILGLDYALLLAFIAGLTNIIPYFGPWIGAIPALIVSFFVSPLTALFTVVAIVIIQQIESNLVSPQIIGRKMHIHPLTVMLLILLSGRLMGILGMIIAVPIYAIIRVLIGHLLPILKEKWTAS
jgi:predicted PurR-regulated permease PerM